MTIKLLVNESAVRQLTGINEAVDANILKPYIRTAQEMRIEPILGTDLYEKMLTDLDNYSGVYATLYNTHIVPTLSWYAVVDAMPTLRLRVGNGGIFSYSPTNSQVADTGDFSYILQDYKAKADHYASRMSDYLCSYASDFPELNTNTKDDLHPNPAMSNFGFGLEPTNPTAIVRDYDKK